MIGRDGIAALVILAVSAVLLALTLGLRESPFVPVGPGFYPRIVLGVTALFALALLASDIAARRRGVMPPPVGIANKGRIAALFAAFVLYLVMLPLVGFRVSTLVFVALAQAVLAPPRGARQWITLAIVAILATAATWFVFERYLLVLLPRGRWTGF